MLSRRNFLVFIYLFCGISLLPSCDQGFSIPFHSEDNTAPTTSAIVESLEIPSQLTPAGTPTATLQPAKLIDVPPSDLRGVIIHFWHNWSGPAGDLIQSLVEDFNLHNEWGIMVVPVRLNTLDEMTTDIEAALNTSDEPDLIVGYPHQYLEWDEIVGLVDLRPYVSDPVWGFSMDEQADFYPVVWEQDVLDGKRLGMPAQRSAQVLIYNETWAQSLGFRASPVFPEQFMEQACASARQNSDQAENDSQQAELTQQSYSTGGLMVSTNYAAILGWIYSFGGDVIHSPEPGLGQTVYNFGNPQIEETFIFLRGLYDQLCAWQPENQYPISEFISRQGLFFTGSVTNIPDLADAFNRTGNHDQWTVIPFPSPSTNPAIDVYGPSFVVLPSTPQRQLAAWLLVKWLLSPSNHALLVEETSALPLRISALDHLATFQNRYPQWTAALELFPQGRSEPLFQSWSTVRWALSDASTQLFRDYFTIDQVPVLIDYLDDTAAELHLGLGSSGIYPTPTPSPGLTIVPIVSPTSSLTATSTRSP
jgi:multiple sugar transport system substrate-binding protein